MTGRGTADFRAGIDCQGEGAVVSLGMSSRRPEVFLSASTRDLASTRLALRDALLSIGCHPLIQEHFGPDARTVTEMLRNRVQQSDAVIHLAGICHGKEPFADEPLASRRSYTQMECDFARELGVPLYLFLLAESFPYDSFEPEEDEKRQLQQQHRAAIRNGNQLYQPVSDLVELEKRVRELRIEAAGRAPGSGTPDELDAPRRGLSFQFRGCSVSLAVAVTLGIVAFVGITTLQERRSDIAFETGSSPYPTPPPSAIPPKRIVNSEPAEPPPVAIRPAKIDMDVTGREGKSVRIELLTRIDQTPSISTTNKDKLYTSVERAKSMGKIITIPLGSGGSSVSASDVEILKATLESPEVMKLRDDRTVVFIILGYADSKGDDKKAIAISQNRADSVYAVMRDTCNVANAMHAVGMGRARLLDADNLEKNRIVEVWAMRP